jgi:hypothetical protein
MLHCICQSTVCSFGFPLCYLPATLPQRDKRHLHPQPDTRSPSWTAIPVFHVLTLTSYIPAPVQCLLSLWSPICHVAEPRLRANLVVCVV